VSLCQLLKLNDDDDDDDDKGCRTSRQLFWAVLAKFEMRM